MTLCPITCSPQKSDFHLNLDHNLAILDTHILELQAQHHHIVQESLTYLGHIEAWLSST